MKAIPIKMWSKPETWRSPVSIVPMTKNHKTGPIAVTHVSQHSCPTGCGHWSDCYAVTSGKQAFTTLRLNSCDVTDPDEIAQIEANGIDDLPGALDLRAHIVGDCTTSKGANLVGSAMVRYTRKRYKRRAWTYTHGYLSGVKRDDWKGARVLASVENKVTLKKARSLGYTQFAVSVAERHPTHKPYTDKRTGLKVLPCPAQFTSPNPDKPLQCVDCSICQDPSVLEKAQCQAVAFQPDSLGHTDRT
jgi:hypothetical protein